MLELLVNNDAWNSLPPDLQAIIETAAKAVNQDLLDEYTASNNKALKELIETHGVELRKLPEEVIMEFKKISDEIIMESLNDETIRKVHTSFQDFLDEVSDYHSIAEDAFVEVDQVVIKDLGKKQYQETFSAMKDFVAKGEDESIWMLEHDPVFTLGTAADQKHILKRTDIDIFQADREERSPITDQVSSLYIFY